MKLDKKSKKFKKIKPQEKNDRLNKSLICSLIILKECIDIDKFCNSKILEDLTDFAVKLWKQNKNNSFLYDLDKVFIGTEYHIAFIDKVRKRLAVNYIDGEILIEQIKQRSKVIEQDNLKKEQQSRKRATKIVQSENYREDALSPWRLLPGSYGSGKRN